MSNESSLQKLSVFSKKLDAPVEVTLSNGSLSLSGASWRNGWSNGTTWINDWSDGTVWNNGWHNGCYITTACVERMGLEDDCDELIAMRDFRDSLASEDPEFRRQVHHYYQNAPLIVEKIMARNDRETVLADLYDKMIRPCADLFINGKADEAKALYLAYYDNLVADYLA